MTDGNDPAFAREASTYPDEDRPSRLHYFEPSEGLTKREYFAAMAMQGLIASTLPVTDLSEEMYHGIPIMAVFTADKLIEALNR